MQCQQELKSSDCLQQYMGPILHTEQLAYSNRIRISVHNRTNRSSTCKFISRHRIATHRLLDNTLPLLSIDRRSLCNHGRFHSIIPTTSPIRRNIRSCKLTSCFLICLPRMIQECVHHISQFPMWIH